MYFVFDISVLKIWAYITSLMRVANLIYFLKNVFLTKVSLFTVLLETFFFWTILNFLKIYNEKKWAMDKSASPWCGPDIVWFQ